MAFTLVVKNTSVSGKLPTALQLQAGELAINLADQKLYSKNTSDEIFEIGVAGQTPSGDTDNRPDSPSIGDLYYDIDLGDLLVWNGSEWVPVGQEAIALNDLTDVDTTSGLADGTVLGYDGSVWKPVNPASLAVDVDLGYTPDGDNAGTVTNTAGDDATIPIATDTVAGLFTGAEKQKLAGIDEEAKNFTAGRALTFDSDTLNADIATDAALGVVSIGDGIDVTPEGEISVTIDVPPGTIISETAPDPAEAGQLWWADTDVDEGGGRLYIYTGDEWVDTSLPGAGSYLTTEQADDLYLSKTVDDVAEGSITFNSRCTFDSGLSLTNNTNGSSGSHINIEANGTADLFATSGKLIRTSLNLTGTRNQDLAVFWINPVPSSLTLNGKFSGFSCADLSPTEATVSDTVTGFRSGITAGNGRYAFLATVSPGETAAVSRFDGGLETTKVVASSNIVTTRIQAADGDTANELNVNGIHFSESRNIRASRNGSPMNLSSANQRFNFMKADGSTGYQIDAEGGTAGFVLPADSADAGNYDADGNYEGPIQYMPTRQEVETLKQEKAELLETVNDLLERVATLEKAVISSLS